MALTYAQLAARDGDPYMVRLINETRSGSIRFCISFGNINQAIDCADGSEHAELLAIDEPISGSVVETKLADILAGDWYICDPTKELTMAKVMEAKKTNARKAQLDELLGTTKKIAKEKPIGRGVVVKKTAKKSAASERNAAFEPDQRIKVLKKYDKTPREGSNLDLSLGVLKNNITIADWNKARAKAGVENVGFGYLHMLVNEGYVKVV